MSRNRCDTKCAFCGETPEMVEEPREITVEDCGSRFIDEYRGMIVAKATCWLCGAKYLAWLDGTNRPANQFGSAWPRPERDYDTGKYEVADLSFRSSFNDEPGDDDMPTRSGMALKRAAPDMFEALHNMANDCTECGGVGYNYERSHDGGEHKVGCFYCSEARAALAKARGEKEEGK